MSRARVLIIEDEAALASVLAHNLEAEGLAVSCAADGRSGALAWREGRPDLVVLDVMLPYKDGYSLCREQRGRGDATPVLFLSAKGRPEERVEGLMAGGDDYLAKPFHLPEFLLRVERLLQRAGGEAGPLERIEFGGNSVNLRSFTARTFSGRELNLSEREAAILRALAANEGAVLSRNEILDAAWGAERFPSSRTVDNFVMRLRRYFERNPVEPAHIHTVWGVGYRFTRRESPGRNYGAGR